jgi:glycosyltransferase involved in cell wall biosynthesis
LTDRTRFEGATSYDEMPRYFRQIDILAVPTQTTSRIREQFGRVIVEGMACGVPVVGSTCGAIPEVIGDAGLVVPEGDEAALAGALKQLITNKAQREEFARAGRQRVVQHYSWDCVASGMYELFSEVLQGPVRSAVTERWEVPA